MICQPCFKCGRQPKFERVPDPDQSYYGLTGIRAVCRGFWGIRTHRMTKVMWNENSWADLAFRRARDAWDFVDNRWPRQWPGSV